MSKFLSLFVIVMFLTAGCSTFDIGIETNSPQGGTPDQTPTENDTPETTEPFPTDPASENIEPAPQITETPSLVPDLVTIAHLRPFGSEESGVLVLDVGKITVQPSPVPFQIFWEYSPGSGKLAYSPEFFHGSEQNNVSVTSLWVYDYATGEAEMWLEDNVARAAWTPGGERLTAAIYNPETAQIDLVFVDGPQQVELIADCASQLFSWSPEGNQLAFVNAMNWAGMSQACAGTFIATFPGDLYQGDAQIERISDFGSEPLLSGHPLDQPIWSLEEGALIYPDQPFWIVPLDGSPAFVPTTPNGEDPLEIPRPFGPLWSASLSQLVGNVDMGLSGNGGVWVYQLSEDLLSIENYSRIGNMEANSNSDINLVDWWNPNESILVLSGDNVDPSQYLNDLWRAPAVWSLVNRQWEIY